MNDELILVDLDDNEIGNGEKLWVHENDKLHRAFSIFIIDGDKVHTIPLGFGVQLKS